MSEDDDSANRITSFFLGLSLAVVCAFFAWGAYALLTETMNPVSARIDYWAAVRECAASNPLLVVMGAVFCVGSIWGTGLMVLAVVRRRGSK